MATRLTPFSKLLITLLILAAIFFLGRYFLYNTEAGQNIREQAKQEQQAAAENSDNDSASNDTPVSVPKRKDKDALRVQIFTWGGYAPGVYFNEGFEQSSRSRYMQDYNLPVDFILIDDFDASRQAWIADEVDLIGTTVDALPTEMERLGPHDPQIIFQTDWSRGGDAIIAVRGIDNINDLRGKEVAVTPTTPSQTFLYKMLDAADMTFDDIKIQEVPSAIDAASAFKSGKVDAAVVWSPDDIFATEAVPGSKVLVSTVEASNIIADVFIAKKSFVENNRDKIHKFYEGWMRGAAEINSDKGNLKKASKVFGDGLGLNAADTEGMIGTVRLTTHGDNQNFFGMNRDYRGVTGDDLWTEMKTVFANLGFAPKSTPSWRSMAYPRAITSAELSGPLNKSEGAKKFAPATEAKKTAPAISSKPVSISFNTGQSALSENAKTIIDLQFADVAKAFANSRIRVEGNTDNVGARAMNKNLSLKRAQSVAQYLQKTYNMDANRFIIVGNGPDKPVTGCEQNQNAECKAKNRRTDFQLVAD